MSLHLRDALREETAIFGMIVRETGWYTGRAHQLAEVPYLDQLRVRVATCAGQVAGFGALGGPAAAPTLDFLFVHEGRRGRGVGRALVTDLVALAGARGAAGVRVVAHPPTERFFLGVGARRIATDAVRAHRGWCCPVLELPVAVPDVPATERRLVSTR